MFELKFHRSVWKVLEKLSRDDFDHCIAELSLLATNPYPGIGGDKEKLKGKPDRYRIHIGRSYSAIYRIYKNEKIVLVTTFGSINKIHKEYNSF